MKRIEKIELTTDIMHYGMMADPGMEVKQHLTLHESGAVDFETWNYIDDDENYEESRSSHFRISEMAMQELLEIIADKLKDLPDNDCGLDCGSWELKAFFEDGSQEVLEGSPGGMVIEEEDLSLVIRDYLGMADLFLFDSELLPEEEEALEDPEKEDQIRMLMDFIGAQQPESDEEENEEEDFYPGAGLFPGMSPFGEDF